MKHDLRDAEPAQPAPTTALAAAPKPLRTGCKHIVLVCKACEKRSKGPKKITAREVAKSLSRACRDAGVPRARMVLTSCLGACPKKAFTVATTAPTGSIRMLAFRHGKDAAAVVAALFAAELA